jgi:hypothetical protein
MVTCLISLNFSFLAAIISVCTWMEQHGSAAT